MKAYLTRDTNVRTNNGLVPLKKLKEGDIVIAWDGDSICADTVEAVEAAAVLAGTLRRTTTSRFASKLRTATTCLLATTARSW